MIKPEELKDKNFKIFLGIPMYGRMAQNPRAWFIRITVLGAKSKISR